MIQMHLIFIIAWLGAGPRPLFCRGQLASVVDESRFSIPQEKRYLLYGVNMGEGFNLRRDVYMRVANLVRTLRDKGHNFVLVLPPHGGIYHWQNPALKSQVRLPWNLFFDVENLNKFIPVIEFEEFLKEIGKSEIDIVYYLQRYAEGWNNGKWEEKWDHRPCIDPEYYEYNQETERWHGWFFGYEDEVTAKQFHCISIQGQSSTLIPLILQENNTAKSIMIDRAETILHDWFGDKHFWEARRSMRYAKHLTAIADKFRQDQLNSTDDLDQTLMTQDWREMKPQHGVAVGGPYVAVHWRRRDFLRSHSSEVPSVQGTVKQINSVLKKLNLNSVFLATDSKNKTELAELEGLLKQRGHSLYRYIPTSEELQGYKDGGISIIDQWICAHARYFIGTHVSTFSFRIQEDREILGFDPNTSFNRLCPDSTSECEQPAHWTIKYD